MEHIKNACAFTGHRPTHFHFQYNEEHPDCIAIKQAMNKEVCSLIEKGVTTFYSGMAQGVDMWGAELILALKRQVPKLKLIAALPCETQANRWSINQRDRYNAILSLCDETIYVSRPYTQTCMFKRNRYMVDHAQNLIAVYDNQDHGGTAYTIKYAKNLQRNLILLPSAHFIR
ncbi:MAG: DUF1273 domain-containing protein [Clostridiales bacterium]|nr:DUF1273 domain-containing protein [Clostridiales bacterium]